MQNGKSLFRSAAVVVLCSMTMASSLQDSEEETSEPTSNPSEEQPFPRQMRIGTEGLFRPSALLQGWFFAQKAQETATTFRMRRAELRARGEIAPGWVDYSVMVDPARRGRGAASILQDLFVTVKTPYANISLGQFKTPVSWEGYNSSARLLLPERALVSLNYGNWRDMGIRVAKEFPYFGYSAGVFNGSGTDTLDLDNAKDVALRLEAYPIEGLVIGGVAYVTVGNRSVAATDRYEADLRFERGPFLFQSEYIYARDKQDAAPAVKGHGFYGAVAWTFWERLQPAFRVGYMDPNIRLKSASGESHRVWQTDVGLNYYVQKHEMKFQLAYSRFQHKTLKPSHELILAGQVAF